MRHAHQNLNFGMYLLPQGCSDFKYRYKNLFYTARGSSGVHQCYLGGYADHLDECFGIAGALFHSLAATRQLPFTLRDALLVLFLHDVEKMWKYGDNKMRTTYGHLAHTNKHALTVAIIRDYKIELTDEHWNALKYIHGENEEYVSGEKKSGPLGAFVHMCDYWSARGWFDEPQSSGPLPRLI